MPGRMPRPSLDQLLPPLQDALRLAAAGLLCVALATSPAAAAPDGPVLNGGRVRVWSLGAPALVKEVATVVDSDGREMTLRLERSRELVVIPYAAAARIEVSAGRRGHLWRGAFVGAVVGLAAAFVADEIRGRAYRGDLKDPLLFAVGGAALGAALGDAVRTERWEPVSVRR